MSLSEEVRQLLASNPKNIIKDFDHVVIELENVLIPQEQIKNTPSISDGLRAETEKYLRILGCELIQTAGHLLDLPQVAMATGQVLFQRFYYSKSFVKHHYETMAMAALTLASKIEEAPRRVRDVVNVFHHIKQIRNKKDILPLVLDTNYVNLKNQVIKYERRLLKELGFCVHIKHPHKMIVTYLQVLECERNRRLVQTAWNYMNDSFRTDVFVRFPPETIACACIYLAAKKLKVCLPNNPHWFLIFGARESQIREICCEVMLLYNHKKPNADELERLVTEAKANQIAEKLKAKQQILIEQIRKHELEFNAQQQNNKENKVQEGKDDVIVIGQTKINSKVFPKKPDSKDELRTGLKRSSSRSSDSPVRKYRKHYRHQETKISQKSHHNESSGGSDDRITNSRIYIAKDFQKDRYYNYSKQQNFHQSDKLKERRDQSSENRDKYLRLKKSEKNELRDKMKGGDQLLADDFKQQTLLGAIKMNKDSLKDKLKNRDDDKRFSYNDQKEQYISKSHSNSRLEGVRIYEDRDLHKSNKSSNNSSEDMSNLKHKNKSKNLESKKDYLMNQEDLTSHKYKKQNNMGSYENNLMKSKASKYDNDNKLDEYSLTSKSMADKYNLFETDLYNSNGLSKSKHADYSKDKYKSVLYKSDPPSKYNKISSASYLNEESKYLTGSKYLKASDKLRSIELSSSSLNKYKDSLEVSSSTNKYKNLSNEVSSPSSSMNKYNKKIL